MSDFDDFVNYAGGRPIRRELTERCLRCGYPRGEHTYNGACYGICAKFVDKAEIRTRSNAELRNSLMVVADQIRSWLDWNTKQRAESNPPLTTDGGTSIMCLPVPFWPSHGAFETWIELFQQSSDEIGRVKSLQEEIGILRRAAELVIKAWERSSIREEPLIDALVRLRDALPVGDRSVGDTLTGYRSNHSSDCALHNAPALPPGPCDCSAKPEGAE